MEVSAFSSSSRNYFFPSTHLFPYCFIPENNLQFTETPDSHIYSAQIPGVIRKDEIILEVEDSKYLIIRTEPTKRSSMAERFYRRLRLPRQADVDRISAQYVDGVFTVTLPRSFRPFLVDDQAQKPGQADKILARAA